MAGRHAPPKQVGIGWNGWLARNLVRLRGASARGVDEPGKADWKSALHKTDGSVRISYESLLVWRSLMVGWSISLSGPPALLAAVLQRLENHSMVFGGKRPSATAPGNAKLNRYAEIKSKTLKG